MTTPAEKDQDELQYIYLLREREFIRLNENCYKIGRTSQDPVKRFEGYPKGSEIILYVAVDNCLTAEKQLLIIFKNKFQQKKNYGTEYFSGDKNLMIKAILEVATKSAVDLEVLNKLSSLTSKIEEMQALLNKEQEIPPLNKKEYNTQERYINLQAESRYSGVSQVLYDVLNDILQGQPQRSEYSQADVVNEIARYVHRTATPEFYLDGNIKELLFTPDSKLKALFSAEEDKVSLKKLSEYLEVHFV
jgi:hypothetical protein